MNILIPILLTLNLVSDYDVPKVVINNTNSLYDVTTETITLVNTFEIMNSTGYYEEYTESVDFNVGEITDESLNKIYFEYRNIYCEVSRNNLYIEFDFKIYLENFNNYVYEYTENLAFEILLTETYDVEAYIDYIYLNPKYQCYDYSLFNGYNDGFNEGLDIGYENGYNQGVKDGRAEGKAVNNIIEWFGSVWDSLGGFLNLEIAPNITIGGIITIPIICGVLFFGLKALIQ